MDKNLWVLLEAPVATRASQRVDGQIRTGKTMSLESSSLPQFKTSSEQEREESLLPKLMPTIQNIYTVDSTL